MSDTLTGAAAVPVIPQESGSGGVSAALPEPADVDPPKLSQREQSRLEDALDQALALARQASWHLSEAEAELAEANTNLRASVAVAREIGASHG
jgi:hypothetical protein